MWLWILILVFLLLNFYWFCIKPLNYWKEKCVPFIKPFPIVGNVGPSFFNRKSMSQSQEEFYYQYPDKRYVGIYQCLTPTLILRDPELIKLVTVKEFDTFPEHRRFVSVKTDPLWNKTLFGMKGGAAWQSFRSTLSPSFTSSKMKLMFPLMKKCTNQFTSFYLKQGGIVHIEMKDAFARFTNDVIATCAFGVTCDSQINRDNRFFQTGYNLTNFKGFNNTKLYFPLLFPSLLKMMKASIISKPVREFFSEIILETLKLRKKENIVRLDMVHLLMEAQKGYDKYNDDKVIDTGFAVAKESDLTNNKNKIIKTEISDEDIIAQALIFFIAGFDTASTVMSFTAYELAVNPDVQEKLRNEIDEVFKKCENDFTYEAILEMKYMDMVVSETLRKWPPITNNDRCCVKPFTINPKRDDEKPLLLEKGSIVWIPTHCIQRDFKYFPNPDVFDPTRFSDENKINIKPFTYIPFGSGPRNCIGSRFALLEVKLIVAEILSKFEIVPIKKTQIPVQLAKNSFTPISDKGIWLGLKPRNQHTSTI